MDIDELKAFLAVAKHESFSDASQVLFITQPAISKRIARLEEKLGTKLFDRLQKPMSLTQAGKLLLDPANSIIQQTLDIYKSIDSLSNEVAGTLIMATSHHIGLHRLSNILKEFTHNYPKVTLDIRFLDSETACGLVENGEIELAVATLPKKKSKNLKLIKVWQDKMCIVSSIDSPLSKLKNITASKLVEYPSVLPAKGTYTRLLLEDSLKHNSKNLKVCMSTNYLETLKMLVVAGAGWSLMPEIMLDKSIIKLEVNLNIVRDLGVVMHNKRNLSNSAKSMLAMIENNN